MDDLTPKQIENWRRVMSLMDMSMISSIVSDEEVKKFALNMQRQIDRELEQKTAYEFLQDYQQKQQAQRTIQESNRLRTEAKEPISGFRNTVRIVREK